MTALPPDGQTFHQSIWAGFQGFDLSVKLLLSVPRRNAGLSNQRFHHGTGSLNSRSIGLGGFNGFLIGQTHLSTSQVVKNKNEKLNDHRQHSKAVLKKNLAKKLFDYDREVR